MSRQGTQAAAGASILAGLGLWSISRPGSIAKQLKVGLSVGLFLWSLGSNTRQWAAVAGAAIGASVALESADTKGGKSKLESADAKAGAKSGKPRRKWACYRSDFPALSVRPLHLDLSFDIRDDRVVVTQAVTLRNETGGRISSVSLDAKNLKNVFVQRYFEFERLGSVRSGNADFVGHVASLGDLRDTKFKYDEKNNKVVVSLDGGVAPQGEFVLRTVNTVIPTSNILEGIYYDFTLKGKPKTMITQCQQYGFQRICPAIDRMAAKAFYTTTILADKRYTNLISNGDLAPGFYKTTAQGGRVAVFQDVDESKSAAGLPPRKRVKYYNHKVNMASYLFFLGVGCYDTYTKTLEYPDGDKVDLELLSLPPATPLDTAKREARDAKFNEALQCLHDSVLWTYISTGPEACERIADQKRVYALLEEREALKASPSRDEAKLASVRESLRKAMTSWTETGYKYTGQTYREIGMQNSNYGGMENVGNTTILQSRLAPTQFVTDGAYIYMEAVKIHEYYHNINGSQVTGQSPFEIWLNEAVTVHMERKRSALLFGDDFIRLRNVGRAFTPGSGALAQDAGPLAMPVEPEGFNVTQELITYMTYFKAPEFVRMVELTLGSDLFNKGLHRYHETYKNANARSVQWVESMESVAKEAGKEVSLKKMAHGWLKRSYHPHVRYSLDYDAKARVATIRMRQSNMEKVQQRLVDEEKGGDWDFGADFKAPWQFPVTWALVCDGKEIADGMFFMDKEEETLVVKDVPSQPDFFSFARGFSYFGTSENVGKRSARELKRQAMRDADLVNRYMAYRAIADKEKARLTALQVENEGKYGAGNEGLCQSVDPEYVSLHAAILMDDSIAGSARGYIISEPEAVDSKPELAHRYWEISRSKNAMQAAVYLALGDKIKTMFDDLEARNCAGPFADQIHDRSLKHRCLSLMAAASEKGVPGCDQTRKEALSRAEKLISSTFMSDRTVGLTRFLELSLPAARKAKLDQIRSEWSQDMVSCEEYVRVVSNLDCKDADKIIWDLVSKDSVFDINLAGHARTVVRGWAANRKRSVLTESGLDLTSKLVVTVGKVNQMSAYDLLGSFSDLDKFNQKKQREIKAAIAGMRKQLDPSKQKSLCMKLEALLGK